MDTEHETLIEEALEEALRVVLTAPAHTVTVITTTRVKPTALLMVEPAGQRQLRLDKGLGSPDAENVLRGLDEDGQLGLRDAPDALLDGLRRYTRGYPRALEAVKAILDGDDTLTPQDLLDRTRHLPGDRVVEVLVGEAYRLLDTPAQQVIQALAIYPTPVSAVGIDYLLRPVNPTTDAAPILSRLVRRQLVRFHDQHYHLHPVDREYALSQLPPGDPGDTPDTFSVAALQTRAADYYAEIRTPRESWRALDDIQPQLAEFELRCATCDYDTAATVLADIDFDYLRVWGHYRALVDLHERIHGQISDPSLNAGHLSNLGSSYNILGDYGRAIDLYTQALTIAQETGNRDWEGAALNGLGNCYSSLGDYRQAINLHTQALTISREIGNRDWEGTALGNLGGCYYRLAGYRQAIDLYSQVLAIAQEIGDRNHESIVLGHLGNCHYSLGDYRQAIELHTQALTIARDIESRYSEATALVYLGRAWLSSGDPAKAVALLEEAVSVADTTGDLEPAAEARSGLALAQLHLTDPAAALATATAAHEFPTEEPRLRLLQGVALGQLQRVEEAVQAFSRALTNADTLLALAQLNIAALQVRALALSGLAAATNDPIRATQAAEAFTQLQQATRAAGVLADSVWLLDAITSSCDTADVLADVIAAVPDG
jgi:tetratricopeptide (TPR) repeat protein